MKKIFTLSAALLLLAGTMAFAQTQQKNQEKKKPTAEEMAEMRAKKMSEELLLSDEAAAKFTPLYKTYLIESLGIKKKYRPEMHKDTAKTDAEIDSDIRRDFQKSQEILDLRISYYEKFIKILSPRQVRQMYRIEKEQAQKAEFHKYMKGQKGGNAHHHGPQHQVPQHQVPQHQGR